MSQHELNCLDAAEAMFAALKKHRSLRQTTAVIMLKRRFGEQLIYTNDNGNPAIHPDVLAAFRAVTQDQVVWSKARKTWRLRKRRVPPTRRVY